MTPRCVGFSGEAWQRTTPSLRGRKGITLDHAGYYLGAQQYDGWPGEGYDGSSIEGLLAFMVAHPDVDVQSYRWAHQLYDLLVWFNQREHPTTAPLLGIDWHSGMWWPDSSGIIKPTGMVDGGHALICRGYRFDRGWRYSLNGWTSHLWFQLHNSWSREWGDNGRAWIRGDHLQDLMDAQGECGLATKWERAA